MVYGVWVLEALFHLDNEASPNGISQAPLKTDKRGPGHAQETACLKQERLAVAPLGKILETYKERRGF